MTQTETIRDAEEKASQNIAQAHTDAHALIAQAKLDAQLKISAHKEEMVSTRTRAIEAKKADYKQLYKEILVASERKKEELTRTVYTTKEKAVSFILKELM